MTEEKLQQILKTGRIKPEPSDWWDMSIGVVIGMGIYGGSGSLLVMMLEFGAGLIWVYLSALLGIIVFLYWKDSKIQIIQTGLGEQENLELLKRTFKQLNWDILIYPNQVFIEDNKYILKFISARIIYTDDYIVYNFQYTSGVRSGRPAFFLGIRTYLKRRFENGLKNAQKTQ